MAIKLTSKPNTDAADYDYPYGKIRDKAGSVVTEGETHGTPINTEVYGDMHQFFERLMAISGIVHNELPDNDYSGFQLYEAFMQLANGFNATSTTSVVYGTGTKTFTVQLGLSWKYGNNVFITSDADPNSRRMWGTITSYDSETGELVVAVNGYDNSEAGTFTDWTITLAGIPSAAVGGSGYRIRGTVEQAFIADMNTGTSTSLVLTPSAVYNSIVLTGAYNTIDDRKVVKKIIDFGVWDISSDVTHVVSTSINIEQVLSIDGVYYSDAGAAYVMGDTRTGAAEAVSVTVATISDGSITLARATFGGYAATGWDDAVMNRGRLVVTYLEEVLTD